MAIEEQFNKTINSMITKYLSNKVVLTSFLDPHEALMLERECKKNKIELLSHGGIINSERKRYLMTPFNDKVNFKINVYKIDYNKKFYELNHRSVLGSLMGLGIKRECIGDIVIKNKDIYFASTQEISNFLENEFNYVGNTPIKIILNNDIIENEINYDISLHFLSSLRLDAILAQALNISRSAALEKVNLGLVMLNHELIYNNSHLLKAGDELSIRHSGHYKIMSIGDISKSGRIKVQIGKRI